MRLFKNKAAMLCMLFFLSLSLANVVPGYHLGKVSAATKTTTKTVKKGWVTKKGKKYYYKKGEKLTGFQIIKGQTYYFSVKKATLGEMATGWKKIKGNKYYFEESGKKIGQMVTGWKIFGKGCYYFEEKGKKKGIYNFKKSANSKRGSDEYGTAAQKTMRRAKAIVASITNDKMSKEEKLWTCFKYTMAYRSTGNPRPNYPNIYRSDWPVVYANDMFLDGGGTCYSFGAAFAYLAKACGFNESYACNDTGHGWAEVNGKVYDPEEYRNTSHKFYAKNYGSIGWGWFVSACRSNSYMHVKIK